MNRRIDAFELWCWGRLLRVPWTARRSNQSIPKEINHEYSLEELMLKLQYSGHLMWKTDSLEKILMLGKIEDRRRRGRQRMRWLGGITDSMDMSLSEVWELVMDKQAWSPRGTQREGHDRVTKLNWRIRTVPHQISTDALSTYMVRVQISPDVLKISFTASP